MGALLTDLRYGLRMLRKNPGFTAVAVLTLALGIGANTAIFSVVRSVLLRPLPYPHPDRLVVMREYQIGGSSMSVSWLNFLDWPRDNRVWDGMAAYDLAHFTLTGEGEPALLRGATASGSLFSLLGAKPLLGRALGPSDDQVGAPPTTVVTYDLWQKRLGGEASIVGKAVALDGRAYTVVGVLPPQFKDPLSDRVVDLYVPLGLFAGRWTTRDERGSLEVIGRMHAGISINAARDQLNTVEERLEQQYPKTNHGIRASVTALTEFRFGSLRPLLFILLAMVGLVLLIACANTANLLLTRSLAQRKEFAIRQACGASRGRIVRQLLVESALLSLAGGALGLAAAGWVLPALVRLAPSVIPRLSETRIDTGVLLFTLVVSLAAGILFGVVPGLEASRVKVADAVKEASQVSGRSARRWQSAFLVAQLAIAVVLALASGLLVRSLIRAEAVDPGFNPDHVLVMELVLRGNQYARQDQQINFYTAAVESVRHLPGVQSAGMVMCPPVVGHCWDWFYQVEGHPANSGSSLPVAAFNQANPSYFRTMGVPLLAGREFTERDDAQSPPVVIVNQAFARLWWPNASPLGKRVALWSADGTSPYREIVGVTGDIKEDGLDAEQIPEIFIPFAQRPDQAMTLVMRTGGEPQALARAATDAIHALDKDLPIERVQPMNTYLGESLGRRRFSTLLVGLFGLLALVLAAVGVHGVTACTVGQRTREIGIRMALGAERSRVLTMVLWQELKLTVVGVAVGLAGALALTRFLSSLLYGVKPSDLATVVSVVLLLTATALLASLVPALRASRVEPTVALRCE